MQGPQDFLQPAKTAPTNQPPVSSKDQNHNLFYAANGGQMLMSPQLNPGQISHQAPHQTYTMNQTTVDASNAAFAGFRRLLAELSTLCSLLPSSVGSIKYSFQIILDFGSVLRLLNTEILTFFEIIIMLKSNWSSLLLYLSKCANKCNILIWYVIYWYRLR